MTAKEWGEICYKHGYEDRDKEIIRCKDCRYYLEGKIYPDAGRWCHKLADGLDMPPDGYCSYGERKETE